MLFFPLDLLTSLTMSSHVIIPKKDEHRMASCTPTQRYQKKLSMLPSLREQDSDTTIFHSTSPSNHRRKRSIKHFSTFTSAFLQNC